MLRSKRSTLKVLTSGSVSFATIQIMFLLQLRSLKMRVLATSWALKKMLLETGRIGKKRLFFIALTLVVVWILSFRAKLVCKQ